MTAPLRGTPHASALPASQTAPVAEFRCLFTHDVKRKQKRWQDGYLKFHTFNNRVMVCDESRNHIGDTYYKDSDELHEGDELRLDKGVLVEVAEAMGITQTDLAPIIGAKKTKEPAKEAAVARPTPSAAVRPFQRPTSVAPGGTARAASQLRHKSLNTLLGTPKGPVGKAVPMKSPYDTRKEKENEDRMVEERATKRQKLDQRPSGWRASSPVHVEEPSPIKPPPSWARTSDAAARQPSRESNARPSKTITISSESDPPPPISSGVTLPSTPARAIEPITPKPISTSKPMLRPAVVQPELQPIPAPKPPPPKVRLPKKKVTETPICPAPTSSPPVSASNRLANVDFALQPVQEPPKAPSPSRSPSCLKAKSLRLSAGVKRATLLCQSMPRSSSRSGNELGASNSKIGVTKNPRLVSKEPSPIALEDGDLDNRIRPASQTSTVSKREQQAADTGAAKQKKSKAKPPPIILQEEALDDPEIMYGMMDQQLLVLSSPEASPPLPVSPPTEILQKKVPPTRTKPKTAKQPTTDDVDACPAEDLRSGVERAQKNQFPRKPSHVPDTARSTSPTSHTAVESSLSRLGDAVPVRNHTVFDHPVPRFKDISPARNHPAQALSKSASTSPEKLPLSTGGFQKKPKPASSRTTTPKTSNTSESAHPAPRPETVALPPHPLHTGKRGPTMSTTELASVLSKSRMKKRAPVDDPIEDDGILPTKSPARKMRRVRSENDAPIPSTADDWEKRNLPKTSSTLTEPEVDAAAVPQPEPKKKVSALAALVKRTDPRKKFQRTQSLNVDTTVVPMVEPELPSPVIDKDVGPWSTEAFDLFDWRPPAKDDAGG